MAKQTAVWQRPSAAPPKRGRRALNVREGTAKRTILSGAGSHDAGNTCAAAREAKLGQQQRHAVAAAGASVLQLLGVAAPEARALQQVVLSHDVKHGGRLHHLLLLLHTGQEPAACALQRGLQVAQPQAQLVSTHTCKQSWLAGRLSASAGRLAGGAGKSRKLPRKVAAASPGALGPRAGPPLGRAAC